VLRIRNRVPGLGAFLTPGSWIRENQHPDPGSEMNNPNHIFYSLETIVFLFLGVKILKFFDDDLAVLRIRDVYPGSRTLLFFIPDPASELSPSRIPDPH
jgi:hypothetical protein